MNSLLEVNKPKVTQTVVIYGGRFQPFHKGHYAAYESLCSKFGKANVYIGTSNDTSSDKSPFSFKEKKEIATKMFGVPASKFVKVNNPYRPVEILSKFDGKTTQYIAAVGEKDASRLKSGYFKPYKGKAGYGYDEVGYYYAVPAEANPISGTDVRKKLGSSNKEVAKKFFLKAYPSFDREVFKMITSKLNEDGMPGGIGVGLVLPGGYINGAPTGSVEESNNTKPSYEMRAEPHPTRYEKEHPSDEPDWHKKNDPYDPISEIIKNVITNEMFEEWSMGYFNSITESSDTAGQESTGIHSDHNHDWDEFDDPEKGYTDMLPGWEVFGHLSNELPKSVKDTIVPLNNHFEENGPGKRVIHPSKGEEYSKDKQHKWEMNPMASLDKTYKPEDKYKVINVQNINEDLNKNLDVDITYTAADGKQKKIKARDALRLPKDHPAHIQAAKIAGPDDAPVNEPKKKIEPGKAATQSAKPSEPGQPVKQGQTAQGKMDKETPSTTNTPTGQEQGPPPEQKLSGVELKSSAEKNIEKQKAGETKAGYVKRIGDKIKNWSEEEKQFFKEKVHKGGSPERRSWSKAIMDKAKGAGHAIMRGLKHEVHEFKTAAHGIKSLMAGKKLDEGHKKALKSVGIKIATTALFGGITGGLAHGVGGFVAHVAKELIPHAVGEVMLTGFGKAAIFAEGNENEDATNLNVFAAAIAERLENMDITPKMMESMIDSYNNKKLQSKFKLNENLSESKENSINHFVEYATKKLKLKETPKITLLTGREYSEAKTSLGGYNPMSKEIFVVVDGRLTADILRTLAHEMVHRKQDELGLVKDEVKDGATGSPIENQAHAVAGILMRNYGKINKQIYNEDINVKVDKGDTVLMGKFKNKKVVVKDFGKDDHGMPTINGKVATTFRMGDKGQNIFKKDEVDEMKSTDIHFMNIIKLYRDSTFRKRINAYLFGKPNQNNPNAVAKALRNMGYDEIIQMEKELNLKPNFDEQIDELYRDVENFIDNYLGEVSGNVGDDSQPDGGYLPKGKARKLDANDGVNKSDDWFYSGGYTQTEFPVADAIWGDEDENQTTIKYTARNLPRFDEEPTEFLKEGLLLEGGAYGHMSHPFDDMDLTFGDLKNIISKALNGDLGVVREKTDGQALAISWKNGRLIAARNKGHLQNAGANAMGIEDVASKFGGRGGLTDAYNYAMKDLSAAISGLSDAQRKKIFNEGKCFMNLEVIWPTSVNVIPYGQALLVFHNTTCYDEKGTAIGADGGAAGTLAGMIKQINADVQSKYTIQGPPITEIPKSEDLSSKQSKYISKLKKLQSEFGLKDSDNVADYHQSWWDWWITSNAPIKVDKLTKEALIRRWAFGDKGFRLNTISNLELQKWAIDHDKVNVAKQQKDNIKPFEEIFLGVGADVLEFVGSVLTVHPEKAIRSMKQKFKQVATQVRNGGNPTQIQKLKSELERLNQLGGIDKIVANEGLVFFYNGKTYKLTGTFAPLNQILGIFYS